MASGARNNVLAGAFVVVGLVLAVWVSFMLSDTNLARGMRTFTVQFTLGDGALGLKPGSPELLAGQQVGKVQHVDFARAPAPGGGEVVTAVNVAVEVRSDLTRYENAAIALQKPLLGTLSSINISSVGSAAGVPTPSGISAAIEPGDIVKGTIAPPGFLADAGYGPEQAGQ